MSFQKVVKRKNSVACSFVSFRTVSFQKVVKPLLRSIAFELGFRTVSFQKVVKLNNNKNLED